MFGVIVFIILVCVVKKKDYLAIGFILFSFQSVFPLHHFVFLCPKLKQNVFIDL